MGGKKIMKNLFFNFVWQWYSDGGFIAVNPVGIELEYFKLPSFFSLAFTFVVMGIGFQISYVNPMRD
uniref:Uncharacterized protein n=1 Tax=viral metagenome TaxID=1070528 RepID=A0A6M3JLS2_9ZZZZ